MTIVTWQDLVNRHKSVADIGGTNKVGSSYLVYAEAELNSRLAPYYTVPFSSNNLTAKDLVLDMAYARIYGTKDKDRAGYLEEQITKRIDDLIHGKAQMIAEDGTAISSDNIGGAIWSSTENYVPTFGMIDEIDQMIDKDRLDDEYSDRGY